MRTSTVAVGDPLVCTPDNWDYSVADGLGTGCACAVGMGNGFAFSVGCAYAAVGCAYAAVGCAYAAGEGNESGTLIEDGVDRCHGVENESCVYLETEICPGVRSGDGAIGCG